LLFRHDATHIGFGDHASMPRAADGGDVQIVLGD
jgi:hypothetical protein